MTPAEWEAEKARIEERRRDLTVLIRNYTNALDGQIATVVDLHLPYPPKPEKTVTIARHGLELKLHDGQVVGRNDYVDSRWTRVKLSIDGGPIMNDLFPDDIRALASLLPENEEG